MRSTDSDHVPYDIYSKKAAELIELFFLPRFVWGAAFIWKQSLFKTSYLPVTQYHAHVIISV